ncbi:LexA family protein [Glutamicibacter mysorens]|uniref:LexA family protein n=1 Tax=Glutamicibacter mysorens TaxID=257984 RepID=UPI0020C6B1B8|nr:translesion error-prone DNA polymerase V autoproteolytic subunit [Glutamicibacter mysorens]UTM48504.1 translesion error-prone DNA polymerase V autoproteolytic subunit [Glutamicibacter mysorens]
MAEEQELMPPGATQGPVQAVSAMGFPSPARDYFDGGLDLNRLLVRDRVSTFIMRVSGHAMQSAGIFDGDEVIVDRSLSVRHGSVVIVNLNGQMLVRRWQIDGRQVGLLSDESPLPVILAEGDEVSVFGVITRCLHHVR